MSTEKLHAISDLENFINGSQKAAFTVLSNKREKYNWVKQTLIKFNYFNIKKNEKGVVIKYISKITGYSRQQVTRLIKEQKVTGDITYNHKIANGFATKYTKADMLALIEIDELHGTLNGAATKKLCERAKFVYQDSNYERLANISVSHIYNIRASNTYKNKRILLEKTKPTKSNIGKRCKPRPNGEPGYLRIDTVHQGDHDKQKGVYHINAVDEVTQFEIICTVEKISEHYLQPILQYILDAFPFHILGFHSDNGSEYINQNVAKLLNKLHVEFTKSRARKSNDNGLVESKNGSIIRKIFGYRHIPKKFAVMINKFNKEHLNYYLNYHRPCLFASTKINGKGKETKKYSYNDVFTPYEKFKSLPNAATYLKEGVTFDDLEYKATMMSDSTSAKQMKYAFKEMMDKIVKDEQGELTEIKYAI